MTRNKLILAIVGVLAIVLAAVFVSQVRKLQQQLRTSVRIIPTESKSRDNVMRNRIDESVSSARPELLVKFRAGTSAERINEITDRFNDRVQDEIEAVPGLTIIDDPDGADPSASAVNYQVLPEVQYAEPNYEVTLDWSTEKKPAGINDPRFDEQRWLADIGVIEAWATTKGSDQIVVAVLDTGVEYTHVDLRNNMWKRPAAIAPYQDQDLGTIDDLHGYDAVMNDGEPMDDNGHGTSCAGIIGAECGNKVGICGVNWKTKIMPLKFINAGGFGTVADAIEAINYVINRKNAGVNIRVINASWGLSQPSRALEGAIGRAYEAGILFVAASGKIRNTETALHYPADYNLGNILNVSHEPGASFSNNAGVVGPGENILTTALGNEVALRSGASMAASVVSGVAALTLAAHPSLSVDQLRSLLLESVNEKPGLKGKRINAAQAVSGL